MKSKLFELLMAATVGVGLTASVAARTMTVTPHKTANVVDSVALAFGDDDAKTYALYGLPWGLTPWRLHGGSR